MSFQIVFNANSASIQDAMSAISRGVASAAFAVTLDGVLVGAVTDGDIRRALLKGARMSDPVAPYIEGSPISVKETESRAAVLDLMQARAISCQRSLKNVPILLGEN